MFRELCISKPELFLWGWGKRFCIFLTSLKPSKIFHFCTKFLHHLMCTLGGLMDTDTGEASPTLVLFLVLLMELCISCDFGYIVFCRSTIINCKTQIFFYNVYFHERGLQSSSILKTRIIKFFHI